MQVTLLKMTVLLPVLFQLTGQKPIAVLAYSFMFDPLRANKSNDSVL